MPRSRAVRSCSRVSLSAPRKREQTPFVASRCCVHEPDFISSTSVHKAFRRHLRPSVRRGNASGSIEPLRRRSSRNSTSDRHMQTLRLSALLPVAQTASQDCLDFPESVDTSRMTRLGPRRPKAVNEEPCSSIEAQLGDAQEPCGCSVAALRPLRAYDRHVRYGSQTKRSLQCGAERHPLETRRCGRTLPHDSAAVPRIRSPDRRSTSPAFHVFSLGVSSSSARTASGRVTGVTGSLSSCLTRHNNELLRATPQTTPQAHSRLGRRNEIVGRPETKTAPLRLCRRLL